MTNNIANKLLADLNNNPELQQKLTSAIWRPSSDLVVSIVTHTLCAVAGGFIGWMKRGEVFEKDFKSYVEKLAK